MLDPQCPKFYGNSHQIFSERAKNAHKRLLWRNRLGVHSIWCNNGRWRKNLQRSRGNL